jgi:hypothetical protein
MVSFRRKNRKKLQVAANYRASVNGQMAAYAATRKDLQRYLDDVKDFGERIVAFRETLQDSRTKRQSIRGTLASMSPPPALAGEHQALIGVLDKGIAGTEAGINLADATQALRDAGDDYTDGFDLPEYDRFSQVSAEISRELAAATGNWTAAMKTYVSRLKHPKGAPHRPRI